MNITDNQIDMAWKFYTDECNESLMGYMSNKFVFENTVACLGILRCTGCGGKGYDKKFGGGRFDLTCPDCVGHGWIKK